MDPQSPGRPPSPPAAPRHAPRGTVLFRPADRCTGFVVVRSGSIRVSLTAENGREIVLYRVRPGEVCLQTFGCLINGTDYSAEGVAETELEFDLIDAAGFQQRIAADPAFRQQLFHAVASRFADLERLVEDVALSTIGERLARALMRLAGAGVRVDATHEALATEIGSARAVVSRQLASFARDGLVRLERGHIELIDPARLRALAGAGLPD